MKKTLIIVDFQYDFCNPKGSLYVPGAEKAEKAIINKLKKDKDIANVILTLDWHNINHISFNQRKGKWPIHCVKYSQGASISPKIMNTLISEKIPYQIFLKGTDINTEEYGAFEQIVYDENLDGYVGYSIDNKSKVIFYNYNIEICGLAGDYCVQHTYNNLITDIDFKSIFNITKFEEGIAYINKKD